VELLGVRLKPAGARTRAVASVAYVGAEADEIWLDVPADVAPRLAERGEAWLACLLPVAVARGEPLRLPLPVDREMLAGTAELMGVWRAWWPERAPVPLEVPALDDPCPPAGPRPEAAFFSGGVDSFFTALEARERIDTLVSVWGFDVPIGAERAFAALRARLGGAAAELGRRWCWVGTNLRATRFQESPWPAMSHGCALGAVAHALAPRFGRVRIASTHGYANLAPFGSHPLTDPLLSSRALAIEHHGARFRRAEKLERIATDPVVQATLRPCWKSQDAANCSRCAKCFCTMLHLDVLGVLERCTTFDRSRYRVAAASRLHAEAWEVRSYLEDVRALAERRGRRDVVRAIDRGLRHTRRRRSLPGRLRERLRGAS
jgi:hypothetical protein